MEEETTDRAKGGKRKKREVLLTTGQIGCGTAEDCAGRELARSPGILPQNLEKSIVEKMVGAGGLLVLLMDSQPLDRGRLKALERSLLLVLLRVS